MEDAAKYIQRPKLDGNKTEIYRVYYDKSQISFDIFLWIETAAIFQSVNKGEKIFKAFPISKSPDPLLICKN